LVTSEGMCWGIYSVAITRRSVIQIKVKLIEDGRRKEHCLSQDTEGLQVYLNSTSPTLGTFRMPLRGDSGPHTVRLLDKKSEVCISCQSEIADSTTHTRRFFSIGKVADERLRVSDCSRPFLPHVADYRNHSGGKRIVSLGRHLSRSPARSLSDSGAKHSQV